VKYTLEFVVAGLMYRSR